MNAKSKMKPQQISLAELRNIVLNAQLLQNQSQNKNGKEGVQSIIDHLGYLQIDTISVIQRCHHHILWTRLPDYREEYIHELQTVDRSIFEYWGHAMSYLPMADYRFSLPRMKNLENPISAWSKKQYEISGHLLEPVLQRIRSEGPLSAKDFEHEKKNNSGWWQWKPAKVALELLFWRGDLMISERRKFQKVYDLTERVLPGHIDLTTPTKTEIGHFLVRRALQALGAATEKEILRFMQPGTARDSDLQIAGKEIITRSLNELMEMEEIIPVIVSEVPNSINWVSGKTIEKVVKPQVAQVHLLSPFDNLVIQRERLKRLFNFDYTLECYVPAAKRKYGYFVLPILWGGRFVARVDVKADRKKGQLNLINLFFESGFDQIDTFLSLFAAKLRTFADFNDCTSIKIQKVSNDNVKSELKSLLA